MKIEQRPISDVRPYEKNPRKNLEAVDAVAASLREFGFRQPIVVDREGVIVVGHTRWMAAQKIGLKQVPVHVALDLTPEQASAYRIADNQTATIASWDMDLLAVEIGELKDAGFDLDLLGFPADDLSEIMSPDGNQGLVDPDDVPAQPDVATTQKGDIWVMGGHRLLCGDSGLVQDLDRLLAGEKIHLVNTDPPYNVKVEPRGNAALLSGSGGLPSRDQNRMLKNRTLPKNRDMVARDRTLDNDFLTDEEFEKRLMAWFGNIARVLIPGGAFYIWGGSTNCGNYPPALKANQLFFHQGVIWVKEHPALTRRDFMSNHEWCFYGWREGAAHRFFGPANVPDVWSIKKIAPQAMVHLTEKPVELARRAIEYSSRQGENVLDLFGGSGSTLIAAEMMGRRAYLMELDALYCDVIVQRWEKFTGQKAERLAAATPPAGASGSSPPSGAAPDPGTPHAANGTPKGRKKKTPASAAGA